MHELGTQQRFDPFPPNAFEGDAVHRHAANRALVLSALGLTLTGGIEFAIALISGSVGLLGDAIHNLAQMTSATPRPARSSTGTLVRGSILGALPQVRAVVWAPHALRAS